MSEPLTDEQLQYARNAHYKSHVIDGGIYEVASLDRSVLLRLLTEHARLAERVRELEREVAVLSDLANATLDRSPKSLSVAQAAATAAVVEYYASKTKTAIAAAVEAHDARDARAKGDANG